MSRVNGKRYRTRASEPIWSLSLGERLGEGELQVTIAF